MSQKSPTRTAKDVQASPSCRPPFRWTVPQVLITVIHLNNAGAGSEITKTFMKLKWWKLLKVTYYLAMIQRIEDDHSSTLERDVGADGDQSWRTSSAKWLKLCPLSQKSPTRTVEDVQASPNYHPPLTLNCPTRPVWIPDDKDPENVEKKSKDRKIIGSRFENLPARLLPTLDQCQLLILSTDYWVIEDGQQRFSASIFYAPQ